MATATAESAEEPPGERSRKYGLHVGPRSVYPQVRHCVPFASTEVAPTGTHPASIRRWGCQELTPSLALTAMGTPASGRCTPSATLWSTSLGRFRPQCDKGTDLPVLFSNDFHGRLGNLGGGCGTASYRLGDFLGRSRGKAHIDPQSWISSAPFSLWVVRQDPGPHVRGDGTAPKGRGDLVVAPFWRPQLWS